MQSRHLYITWAGTMLKKSLFYIAIGVIIAVIGNTWIWYTLDKYVEEMKADGTLQTY